MTGLLFLANVSAECEMWIWSLIYRLHCIVYLHTHPLFHNPLSSYNHHIDTDGSSVYSLQKELSTSADCILPNLIPVIPID